MKFSYRAPARSSRPEHFPWREGLSRHRVSSGWGMLSWVHADGEPDAERFAERLQAQPEVVYAHPNYLSRLKSVPNDPSTATSGISIRSTCLPLGILILEDRRM